MAGYLSESEKILHSLVNVEIRLNQFQRSQAEAVFQLDRFAALLKDIGNPQQKFRSIQVAGTNGKGSTVNFLQNLFVDRGLRTGSFISPHMRFLHERILLNDKPVADTLLAMALRRLEISQNRITFFEALTAAAFLIFQENNVDIAVIETGLGGRLDSTRLCHADIGIITTIGLDHMHILGDSLQEILHEKLGILHPKMVLILGKLEDELLKEALSVAVCRANKVYSYGRDFFLEKADNSYKFIFPELLPDAVPVEFPELPSYYLENFSLAIAAGLLSGLLNITDSKPVQARLSLPGRYEIMWKMVDQRGRRLRILFDGAHNRPGAEAMIHFLQTQKKDVLRILFFAAYSDKEVKEMVQLFEPLFNYIFLWKPNIFRLSQKVSSSLRYGSLTRWIAPRDVKKLFPEQNNIMVLPVSPNGTGIFRAAKQELQHIWLRNQSSCDVDVFIAGSLGSYNFVDRAFRFVRQLSLTAL